MQITDIVKYYNDYLITKNEQNRLARYKGMEKWFHASSAGNCHLKHLFGTLGITGDDKTEDRSRRLMRLGTLVHEDIQASLSPELWNEITMVKMDAIDEIAAPKLIQGNDLLIEHEVKLPMFNVRGFLDIADINHKDKVLEVFDIKTTASYKWSFIVGRKRDENPNVMDELQIATYGLGLAQEYPGYDIHMYLLYYKKDDSMFREKIVGTNYLAYAAEYWGLVNEFVDTNIEQMKQLKIEADKIMEIEHSPIGAQDVFRNGLLTFCNPGNQLDIPNASWECNPMYCKYAGICPSTAHTRKKRR